MSSSSDEEKSSSSDEETKKSKKLKKKIGLKKKKLTTVSFERRCCSILTIFRVLAKILVCSAIVLVVGAITKSSILAITISILIVGFYPQFVKDFFVALMSSDIRKEIKKFFLSQNHIINVIIAFIFVFVYMFTNIFISILLERTFEKVGMNANK